MPAFHQSKRSACMELDGYSLCTTHKLTSNGSVLVDAVYYDLRVLKREIMMYVHILLLVFLRHHHFGDATAHASKMFVTRCNDCV